MRDYRIKTEPFQFNSIFDLEIHKKVNEHSTAVISGSINRDKEEEYLYEITGNQDAILKILVIGEDEEENILFQGIVTSFRLNSINGYKTLSLELKSATYLMDTDRHIRAFQDREATYGDLIAELMKGYENGNFLIKEMNTDIEELILQYQETDWEFIKRLAGRKQSFIVPADLYPGVRFYFGMPGQNVYDITDYEEYQIQVTDGGYPCYIIKTRENIFEPIHYIFFVLIMSQSFQLSCFIVNIIRKHPVSQSLPIKSTIQSIVISDADIPITQQYQTEHLIILIMDLFSIRIGDTRHLISSSVLI